MSAYYECNLPMESNYNWFNWEILRLPIRSRLPQFLLWTIKARPVTKSLRHLWQNLGLCSIFICWSNRFAVVFVTSQCGHGKTGFLCTQFLCFLTSFFDFSSFPQISHGNIAGLLCVSKCLSKAFSVFKILVHLFDGHLNSFFFFLHRS